jgi:feruloyl esterase
MESYTIPGMAHGTPLAVGKANDQCGAAGAFLLDVSISSSYHIAKFWGLADYPRAEVLQADEPAPISTGEPHVIATAASTEKEAPAARPETADVPHPSRIDIGAVITNALKAAGLMKAT